MKTLYSFDIYGWYTPGDILGRSTEVAPPEESGGRRANWTGETWALCEYVAPPPLPAPPAAPRLITVGAFFDRFGPLKWEILADDSPTVQAVIRDATVRKHIDLGNADLPAGLAILQAAGHPIDAELIIDDPVQPHELP